MRKRFFSVNILIAISCLFAITISLILTFAYQQPTGLKHQTGTVLRFDQHDEKWYDHLFGYSKGAYFNVRLEDGSYYEATGICYDNIDRNLFEDLYIGESITITYVEKSGGLRKIYAVEYMGETYLSLDDVLNEYDQNEKIVHIVGPIMITLSISVGVILVVVNYRKNRWK